MVLGQNPLVRICSDSQVHCQETEREGHFGRSKEPCPAAHPGLGPGPWSLPAGPSGLTHIWRSYSPHPRNSSLLPSYFASQMAQHFERSTSSLLHSFWLCGKKEIVPLLLAPALPSACSPSGWLWRPWSAGPWRSGWSPAGRAGCLPGTPTMGSSQRGPRTSLDQAAWAEQSKGEGPFLSPLSRCTCCLVRSPRLPAIPAPGVLFKCNLIP